MTVVAQAVGPRYRDLVGFRINRVWPTARRRLVGPFVFYDHMLERALPPGEGLDVPPHPHIGLATVTWLFEGELMHRDSIGTAQLIRPGEVNWMIAGRGITHSERSSDHARGSESVLHGTQAWVALPRAREACEPDFLHLRAERVPHGTVGGVSLRLIAGRGFGMASPVPADSPLHYAEARFAPGSALVLPTALGQRAAYVVSGTIGSGGERLQQGTLYVFADDATVRLEAPDGEALVMLFGGEPLGEDRLVWWNFVATTQQQIDAARQRWADRQFAPVPGDAGSMPMPSS